MYPQVLCQHRLTWWNISDLVFFCSVQLVHAGNTVAFATMLVVFQFYRSVLLVISRYVSEDLMVVFLSWMKEID